MREILACPAQHAAPLLHPLRLMQIRASSGSATLLSVTVVLLNMLQTVLFSVQCLPYDSRMKIGGSTWRLWPYVFRNADAMPCRSRGEASTG